MQFFFSATDSHSSALEGQRGTKDTVAIDIGHPEN